MLNTFHEYDTKGKRFINFQERVLKLNIEAHMKVMRIEI